MNSIKIDFLFLLTSILLGACGQILLKFAVGRLGPVILGWPEVFSTLIKIFLNGWVVLGITFFVASMVLWIRVISNMELSRAYPSVGLSYCLVFISSVVIFKETVNLNKIVGLISILFGVYFLHR